MFLLICMMFVEKPFILTYIYRTFPLSRQANITLN